MPHDSEIPLLVSYSRRIFTQVYQEKFISTLFVMAKKKKKLERNKMDIRNKMEKEIVHRIGQCKNEN